LLATAWRRRTAFGIGWRPLLSALVACLPFPLGSARVLGAQPTAGTRAVSQAPAAPAAVPV